MWATLPPQWTWATTCGVCTARRWLGGYSWALGLHSTRDARGAQSLAVGSHQLKRATTVPAEKSLSFPHCLSFLVKWPHYSPYLQEYGSKLLQFSVYSLMLQVCFNTIPKSDLDYWLINGSKIAGLSFSSFFFPLKLVKAADNLGFRLSHISKEK